MSRPAINPKAQLLCAWAGPVLTVLFFIGFIPLAQFVPPMHPTDTAREIQNFYMDNTDGIRFGMVVTMIGVSLIAPWGVSIAMWTTRGEKALPVLRYTQLISIAICTVLAILFTVAWGLAAFRPDDVTPDITRTLNDLGWMFFLFDWPPFLVWFAAVALSILWDDSDDPTFPRWAGYLTLWVALLSVPAGLMLFFKTGPFAYNGLVTMYIPLTVFFVWIVAMTWLTVNAIKDYDAASDPQVQREVEAVG